MSQRSPFVLKDRKIVYENPWIRVEEDAVCRPDGKDGIFGVVRMVAGVSVLPVFADGSVLLAREYKYAVARDTVEVISGAIDAGEAPLEAAQRELQEEAGCRSSRWLSLGVVDPFTTVIDSPNHLFLALDVCDGHASMPDPGELITTQRVPFAQALKMVLNADITHAGSCVLILKAQQRLTEIGCVVDE